MSAPRVGSATSAVGARSASAGGDARCDVELVTSLEAFRALAGEWDALLARSAANGIFLTWEWLFTWAECYLGRDRRLFVVLVREKSELVGAAPWYVATSRTGPFRLNGVRFLGAPETGADYLDVVIKRGRERHVSQAIVDFLYALDRRSWDHLHLRGLSAHSPFLTHLLDRLRREKRYVETAVGAFCPCVALPETAEAFHGSLSPSRRKRFRYDLEALRKQGRVEHAGASSPDGLATLLALYRRRWGGRNEQFPAFVERVVERCGAPGWVRIEFLKVDGVEVAGLLLFTYGTVTSLYLMAVDVEHNPRVSLGNVLVGLSIEAAIRRGSSVYDFLRGIEEYKFNWAGGGNRCVDMRTCRRGAGTLALVAGAMARNLGKLVLGR